MTRTGFGTALLLLLLLAASTPVLAADTVASPAGPDGAVALRWALGSVGDTGAPTAIQKDTQLEKGSKLKFLVEPMSACSVYLLLLDSGEDLHVLYREAPKPAAKTADGKPTYIPAGSQWFELDDGAGLETFFLLASRAPLADLDRLLDGYARAAEAARKKLGGDIVAEVRRLQKAHRNFERPVEKPVMIGGRTRGTADASAIDRLAVEVTADEFYDKTITIEH